MSKEIVNRNKIHRLENTMMNLPQVKIKTTHIFAKGLYAREIVIPPDTVLTGKIHTHEHLNIISKGTILIFTDQGFKKFKAPCTLISPPGTKRVGYALEETVWTTIHANPEEILDFEILEKKFVRDRYNEQELLTDEELDLLKEAIACPTSLQP